SVILVRSFHDRNFNGIQDPGEEELDGRALRVTDPDLRTFTLYMPTMIVAREAGTYTLVEVTPDGARQTMRGLNGTTLSLHPDADPVVAVFVDDPSKKSGTHTVSYGYVGLGQVRACKILDEDGDGVAESGERGLRGWWIELSGTDAQGETVRPVVRTTGDDGCVTFTGLLPGDYTVSEAVPAAGASETNDTASHEVTIASSISGSSLAGSVDTVNFTLSRNIGLRYQNLLTDDATSDTASSTRHR
ncbi:MAG: prealbumin-like fold domain-containing protein, partial [Gemmatimonadales bacterium]